MKPISGSLLGLIAQPFLRPDQYQSTFEYIVKSLNEHPYAKSVLAPIDQILWSAVYLDAEKLLLLNREKKWDDSSVVKADSLGLLWPNGEPDWKAVGVSRPLVKNESMAELPSREYIGELPKLARVALASRAARRSQPIFTLAWPEAPDKHIGAVDAAIAFAEAYARAGGESVGSASDARLAFAQAATAAANDARAAFGGDNAATAAANAASYSAMAMGGAYGDSAVASVDSAERFVGFAGSLEMVGAIGNDYRALKAANEKEKWTDTTSVDPGPGGPMGALWPGGEPDWKSMAESRQELPTEEEIKSLPWLARVALAARAARRAQPIFTHAWPDAPQQCIDAVNAAITLAENTARGSPGLSVSSRKAGEAAKAAAADAERAAFAATDAKAAVHAGCAASIAAADADASSSRWRADAPPTLAAKEDSAYDAPTRAAAAAEVIAGPEGRSAMISAIARDFRALTVTAKKENWTKATHVDPGPSGPMGPLWKGGEAPPWARPPQSLEPLPQLAIEIAPGDATPEMIANYLGALSDLFHASGGVSLRFERSGTKIYAMAEVPS